jgi:hypothetical protein
VEQSEVEVRSDREERPEMKIYFSKSQIIVDTMTPAINKGAHTKNPKTHQHNFASPARGPDSILLLRIWNIRHGLQILVPSSK